MTKKIFITSFAFIIFFALVGLVQASETGGTLNPGLVTGMNGVIIAAPTASPVAGTYHVTKSVTLTAAGSTAICYTRDDTTPACSSSVACSGTGSVYDTAISVTLTDTIKSIACYADSSSGDVSSDTYTLTCSTTSVTNGTVGAYSGCAITCDSGYTLSGSECNASGGGGGGGGTPAAPSAVSSSNVPLSVLSTQAGTLTQSFSDSSTAKVEVPKGALTKTTTFSVAQGGLTGGLIPTDTMGAILIGNTVFNFNAQNSSGQSVTSFSSDLTITLTVPDLTEGSDLGVYYYNRALDKWELIPGAEFDFATNTVSFGIDHLTRFGVFEIAALPEYIDTEEGAIVEDSFWTAGRWVKTEDRTTVYFVDNNDKRHAYSNQSIWESYFGTDFSFVETITNEELATYSFGSNVPYAAGTLIKIPSVPKVYLVGENGAIQWVNSETKAVELFGADWAGLVKDLSEVFFMDYTEGDAIE